jgi:dienelactone hydrolase
MKNSFSLIVIFILFQLIIISGNTIEMDSCNFFSDFNAGSIDFEKNELELYSVKYFENLYDANRDREIPTSVYFPKDVGCYPLIVVSHGAGGDRNSLLSHVEQLVVENYVVIIPEHIGSNRSLMIDLMDEYDITFLDALIIIASNTTEWKNRPKDISFLIDMASYWNESDTDLFGKIDLASIGCMGHSYGAYTTSAIMGALVNMPQGLSNFSDPRVDAGLAISPQGPDGSKGIDFVNSWFVEESWDTITRPVSHHDEDDQMNNWRKIPFESMPYGDKYFLRFKNSKHIDFANSEIYELFNDSIGQLRNNETIKVSKKMALHFFNIYLKGMENETYSAEYANSLCQSNEIVTEIFWDQKQGLDVSIVKPSTGYLHMFNKSLFPLPFDNTMVIGGINIQVIVEGFEQVENVEFYIDEELKNIDYNEPFQWVWDERVFDRQVITVLAMDENGNTVSDEIAVLKIL